MSEETKKPETEEPTENFQSLIRSHQTKHKSTLTEAMKAVVKTNPEAHQKYLQAGCGPLNKIDADEAKDFETLVSEYQERNGCSRVASLQAIAKAHPNKHREFIESANQR
jgi:hypothetical protein